MKRWVDAFRGVMASRLIWVMLGILATYTIAQYAVLHLHGLLGKMDFELYSMPMRMGTMLFIVGLVSWRAIYIMVVQRPARLTVTILKDLRDNYFSPEKLAHGIPVVLIITAMFSVFTTFKSLIPVIHPFEYDALFARIDRMVHLGHNPWEILFPVLKIAVITTMLSFVYKTWFVVKFCVLYWQAFSLKNRILRARFFVSFMLIWIIIGTIMATMLSSAGPCYYGLVTGLADNPYAPLMQFLHETAKVSPVWDLHAQDYLWKAYENRHVSLFSGISAMPSMHISVTFLFALLAWRTNRVLGWLFTAYLALMMITSVHLGWHYAIDGYVGIAVTFLIWTAVGWVQSRYQPKGDATAHDRAEPTRSPE